jgi:hypothetical protein
MSEGGTLGQLVVQLVADTVRFEGDLGKASEIARDRAEEIHGFFKSNLARVTAELTGVAAALIETLHAGVERADSLRVMGQELGVTVTSMSQLAFAANQADVPLDTLQNSMKLLAKNVGLAAGGNYDAIQKFNALGIAFRDAHGNILPLDQILSNTAAAFESFKDSPIKTADAIEIMGRSGEQLLPLLDEGAKSIAEMRKRSDELGYTISGLNAKELQEFDDKWKEIKAVWVGARTTFAAELAPLFKELIEYLEQANKRFEPFQKSAELIKGGFHIAGEAIDSVKGIVKNTGDYFEELWSKMKKGDVAGIFGAASSFIKKDFQTIAQVAKDANTQLDAAQKKADDVDDKKPGGKRNAPNLDFSGESIKQQYDEIYTELEKRTTESTLRQSQSFNEMANNWKGSLQRFQTNFYHIWDDFQEIGAEGARNVAQDFENFLVNPAQQGFKGLLNAWIKTLEQMVAKALTVQIFSALFGGTASGGATSGLGSFFSAALTYGGGRAAGGPISGGTSYLVGENGPELFTPAGNGRITPNGVGGSTVFNHHYYIDAKGADAERIQRILPAMMEQTRAATKRDIYDAFRRSGLQAPRFA